MDDQQHTIIEEGRRLSESSLWRLQQAFYDHWGVDAWSQGKVPYYVTNNPFIANAYAETIRGFMRDCLTAGLLDPGQPVTIVELGTGSGRFGFLLLKRLLDLNSAVPRDSVRFRYVMSDVTESNLRFLNDHPLLSPFLEKGVLDLALFDATQQQEMRLWRWGTVLSAESMLNPIVVVANYVFDSMIQDAFRIEGNALLEGLFMLFSDQEHESDLADPQIRDRLAIGSRYSMAADDAYYKDPIFNQILEGYRQRFTEIEFLFPIGALRCIRNLMTLSRGNLLLLVADKGYCQERQLLQRDTDRDVQGALKMEGMTVNLHAIRQYLELRGGHALHTSPEEAGLVISAGFSASLQSEFLGTRAAFAEEVEEFSPYHFYSLVKGFREGSAVSRIGRILSLLRLSHWDPQIVLWFAGKFRELAPSADESFKQELEEGMERVWGNYFPIGEKDDLPFEIGTVLQVMDRPAAALRFYNRSRRLNGEHQATAFNCGLCHHQLGQREEALRFFEMALELDPDFQQALDWKSYLESLLSHQNPSEGFKPSEGRTAMLT